MIKLCFTFVLIVVGLFVNIAQSQPKRTWTPFGLDNTYIYSYDSLEVSKVGKHEFAAWLKTQPLPDSLSKVRNLYMRLRNPISKRSKNDPTNSGGYEKYVFTIQNVMVDCKKRTIRYLSTIDYDENGIVLMELTPNQAMPQKIVPGSIGGTLADEVCH